MHAKPYLIPLALLFIFAPLFISTGCTSGKEKPAVKPGQPQGAKDDFIDTSLNLPNIGVLDSPKLPYEIDAPYLIEVTNGGVLAGRTQFTFSKVGEDGLKVSSEKSIFKPGTEEEVMSVKSAYALDNSLRPKIYAKRQGSPVRQSLMIKSLDFTGGAIYIETRYEPSGEGPIQNNVKRPRAEIWPYDFDDVVSLVVIAACIDPSAKEAGLWILDINREIPGRFAVALQSEEPVTSDDGVTSIIAKKYDVTLDGLPIGTFIIAPGGRLMSVDQPGGLHATIKVL